MPDPYNMPSYGELLARIERLEKAGGVTLGDLPIRQLQDKLEADWQPSGSLLLQRESITGDRLAPATVTADRLAAMEAITAANFFPNWANFSTSVPDATQTAVGSYKDQLGIVHVQGLARRLVAAFAFPTSIIQLPVAHRPALVHGFSCYSVDSGAIKSIWRVVVNPDGSVVGVDASGSANGGVGSYVYLDGITFRP